MPVLTTLSLSTRQRAMLRAMGVPWLAPATPADASVARPVPTPAAVVPARSVASPSAPTAKPAHATGTVAPAAEYPPATSWAMHHEQVNACRACDLAQHRASVQVAQGDRNTARWLFVAAHPSAQADAQALLPAAQQALWQAMGQALGVPAEAMMLTTLTKCTPPSGHWPSPTHEQACQGHTRDTVALLQPDVVIALGAHVAKRLLQVAPETTLGELRGRVHTYQGCALVVTHALDALLTQHADKAQAWDDLCLAHHACPPKIPA